MQIILVRHGLAEDLEIGSDRPDSERQLTKKGRKQMKQVAKGLRRILNRVDCIATSPYTRAVQTAEILVKGFKGARRPEMQVVATLTSGSSPESMTEWLAQQDPEVRVILVGHEPDFSELLAYLTTSGGHAYAKFAKAGACLVESPSTPAAASGRLMWMLTPSMFKWIGV